MNLVHPILGPIPDGWEACSLSELCTYIQRGKSPSYVEESSTRALNQRAIRWGEIEEEHLKYHDEKIDIPLKHFIQAGDIVVNSTGDITIGRAYLFRETPKKLFADSHVTIIRTKSNALLPEYLVNLFATREYQDLIYSLVTGSTGQLEFNKSNLENLPILCPPIRTQKRLAELWRPLYESILLADKLRRESQSAIRAIFERDVMDDWRGSRWKETIDTIK
jgi:type I restriction enzyme S subunit